MASREETPKLHGVLLVDKPPGLTSAAVVARVKRLLGQRKVGHLGTLDPFATGLLPICLGEGTKVAPYLSDHDKRYIGVIALGTATDTLDVTGTVVATREVPTLTPRTLARAVTGFRGDIQQTPPMYSALKRDGVPLYRHARAGREIERAPRPVHISRFEVAMLEDRCLGFAVTCSKGTYVRTLAADLGEALGTVAHLAVLRRTGFGPFDVGGAITLEALESRGSAAGRCARPAEQGDVPISAEDPAACPVPLLSLSAALAEYRAIVADAPMVTAIRRGQQYALAGLGSPRRASEIVRIEDEKGDLVAIVEGTGEPAVWRLGRVIAG